MSANFQGQIEDSPTDTDSDDAWFNEPRRRWEGEGGELVYNNQTNQR